MAGQCQPTVRCGRSQPNANAPGRTSPAYSMSGHDQLYLEKARDLGDRLLPIFDTVGLSRQPAAIGATTFLISILFLALWHSSFLHQPGAAPGHSRQGQQQLCLRCRSGVSVHLCLVLTAPACLLTQQPVGDHYRTLQLEMRYLSELTGDPKYWQKAKFAMEKVIRAPKKDGLVPLFMESVAPSFYVDCVQDVESIAHPATSAVLNLDKPSSQTSVSGRVSS